jgi:hypothetical protein
MVKIEIGIEVDPGALRIAQLLANLAAVGFLLAHVILPEPYLADLEANPR